MTPFITPIAPLLPDGKPTVMGSDLGFYYSLCGRPTMQVLSSLLFHSPKQSSESGANQSGQPEARQHLQSSNDCSITFCQTDRGFLGVRAHTFSQLPLDFDRADVGQTYGAEPSACEIRPFSDAHVVDTVALPRKPSPFALEWLLAPKDKITLVERIMARLIQAEAHETDIWYRQDYRQAFICVSLASKGNTEPFMVSSYQVYGLHPDKVWPAILHNRQARLAKEFPDWYDAAGNMRPDVPKKPSVPSPTQEAAERSTKERLAALIKFNKEGA
jgi:hypothetical protein